MYVLKSHQEKNWNQLLKGTKDKVRTQINIGQNMYGRVLVIHSQIIRNLTTNIKPKSSYIKQKRVGRQLATSETCSSSCIPSEHDDCRQLRLG